VQRLAYDRELLSASEGETFAFFHALVLLDLVSTAAVLFISLASGG